MAKHRAGTPVAVHVTVEGNGGRHRPTQPNHAGATDSYAEELRGINADVAAKRVSRGN